MLKGVRVQILAFIFTAVSVNGQMDTEDTMPANLFNPAAAHDLTDNDLKLALSDLSLKDLKSLQAFVDSIDYNGMDHRKNDFTNKKVPSYDFDQTEIDNSKENPDDDVDVDYSFEPKDIENSLVNYHLTATQGNQRSKRNDQNLNSNDEYIQQLVYSFPQNEQLNYNDIEKERSHIRVKRN